jgi:hypothetical protein
MRKIIAFISCLAVFAPFLGSSPQEEYYSYSYARLSYVRGDVFVQRVGDLGYEEGSVNLAAVEGDKLGTRDGRAEVHFGKKNYLRIDNHTQIDFADLPRKGDDRISLHLLSGNIYLRISQLDREKDFEIHTPDASFYILEEGLYRFEVKEKEESILFVLDGAVEVAGEEGSRLINAEESMIASNGYFRTGPGLFYAAYDDSFAEWNKSRDALHNRPVRVSYLPTELHEYEAELAYHGNWVYESLYGYVWVPRVYHYSWRPYHYGRWVWYPIIGWTWVSHEPWGWCVSHYGRWHWRIGLGWYWIPTRHWGPAWVHWYHGSHYYGWCPLSYYNYPVAIVNNHFYGRGYGSYYPSHSRALTVIHKNQLRAPRISKVALSRDKTTKLGKISLAARQPDIQQRNGISRVKNSEAAKVLSRSGLRSVQKSYRTGRTVSLPARKSVSRIGQSSQKSIRSNALSRTPAAAEREKPYTSSKSPSRAINERSADSSRRMGLTGKIESGISRNYGSSSSIKRYPSARDQSSRSVRGEIGKQRESLFEQGRGIVDTRSSSRSMSSKSRIRTYESSSGISYRREKSDATIKQRESSKSWRGTESQRQPVQSYSSARKDISFSRRPSRSSSSSPSYGSPKRPSYSSPSRNPSSSRHFSARSQPSSRSKMVSPKSSSSSRIRSSSPSRASRPSSSSYSQSSSSGRKVKK